MLGDLCLQTCGEYLIKSIMPNVIMLNVLEPEIDYM